MISIGSWSQSGEILGDFRNKIIQLETCYLESLELKFNKLAENFHEQCKNCATTARK